MVKNNNHILYYIILFTIFSLGFLLIIYLSPQKDLQMITLIGLSVVYAAVGIFHHYLNHDLVLKIVVEYVLIAALGAAAAYFIFKGGFGI